MGLVVLDGVVVGLAVGYGCYHQCGHGSWLCCWAFFFLLGLLGSNGGLVSGYSGSLVVGCACIVGYRLICGAGLAVLWVTV